MTIKLLINSFRSHEDIQSILQNEVNENIHIAPWTDKDGTIKGYGVMTGVENQDELFKSYEVLHFLQISLVFVNVPVTWVEGETAARKEPLATWKNIPRTHILEPIDADLIMTRVLDQLGLEKISDNKPVRVSSSESRTGEKRKTPIIVDVYTDKHLEQPLTVVEVEAYISQKEGIDDTEEVVRIELEKIMRSNPKLKYAFGTKHGMKKSIGMVSREEFVTR